MENVIHFLKRGVNCEKFTKNTPIFIMERSQKFNLKLHHRNTQ